MPLDADNSSADSAAPAQPTPSQASAEASPESEAQAGPGGLPHSNRARLNSRTQDQRPKGLNWVVASGALNAAFYTLTFGGSIFVLFLGELGMAKTQIGLLLSLFPFCGVLAPLLSQPVARFGLKRTYITFYGIRKFVVLTLAFVPWYLPLVGPASTKAIVSATVLVFALCRAIAEVGYFPWYQEFVPDRIRGRFAAIYNVVAMLVGAAALSFGSYVIKHGHGLQRFSTLTFVASAIGIISVMTMLPVPAETPDHRNTVKRRLRDILAPLRDGNFRRFLLAVFLGIFGVGSLSFLPLYLKESIGLRDNWIVMLDAAAMIGGLGASFFAGWACDRFGSRPIMMIGLCVMTLVPASWTLLPRHQASSMYLAVAIVSTWGAACMCNSIGSMRLMYNKVVPTQRRTEYMSLWYAITGLAGGISPLLGGVTLDALKRLSASQGAGAMSGPLTFVFAHMSVDIYTPLLLASSLLVGGQMLAYRTVTPDTPWTMRRFLYRTARRIWPLR